MTNDFHVGRMIESFATSQNWSKEDLVEVLGVNLSGVYKKLKMKDLDTSFLKRVADASGITVHKLLEFGVTQIGYVNAVGENVINYKTNKGGNDDKVLLERVAGLSAENAALKEHIKTLNRLIDSYERK